ncbi:MAG TPA: hypothetical protein VK465_01880 [Fibrobacteria bacterium]|nr:hypothetical protein [Fibrobacteria bacterium]
MTRISAAAALMRRSFAVLLLGLACTSVEAEERLLAILPSGESFRQAWSGMKSDLGSRYEWKTFEPDTRNAEDSLAKLVSAYAPKGLVLMDSKAVALAKRLQKRDSAFASLPKFILMTLNAEAAARDLRNSAGVRFEVPAYAIFTQLRSLSGKEFSRIGVLHRREFSALVEDSRRLLAREKLELIGQCVDCDEKEVLFDGKMAKRLTRALDALQEARVEVVWMLPDNALVNAATVERFWAPRFRRGKMPLVVPLANLAGKQANLGLFSAYPDFYQLGVQAAQQVVRVLEEESKPAELGFEPLISVQTTLNLGVSKRLGWEIRAGKLDRVKDLVQP